MLDSLLAVGRVVTVFFFGEVFLVTMWFAWLVWRERPAKSAPQPDVEPAPASVSEPDPAPCAELIAEPAPELASESGAEPEPPCAQIPVLQVEDLPPDTLCEMADGTILLAAEVAALKRLQLRWLPIPVEQH